MAEEDYYKILGVDRNATQDQISHAYRELAKKWHPDINHSPDATAMFEKITKAYDVLKDPQKRQAYDQFGNGAFDENGNAGFNASNFNGFNASSGGPGFGSSPFDDIFNQFFGGAARGGSRASRSQPSAGPTRGEDTFMRMKISFKDSILGRNVQMPYEYETACAACGGKGAVSPSDISVCPTCHGSGVVTSVQRTLFGTFQSQSACPDCGGKGTRIVNPCANCRGTGYVKVSTTLNINVPAGISQGQQLRVPGKGGRGSNGGPNGDLYIEILVDKDDTFTRDGNDIHVDAEVPLITAVLGGYLDVKTVYGIQTLEVKNGTQPGTIAKIKGAGVKGLDGKVGDEYVHLTVKIPTRLNAEEKSLYSQLGQIALDKGEAKGFLGKIFKKKMK